MLRIEQRRARDRDPDEPWMNHFYVSLESSSTRRYLRRLQVWHPPTDVYETDSHVTVKIEVAGVCEDDLVVSLHGRTLTVCGRRDDPAAKLGYEQMEISYGEFRSEVALPCDVAEDAVQADYDRGFLYIRLPKQPQERKVPITVVDEKPDHSA